MPNFLVISREHSASTLRAVLVCCLLLGPASAQGYQHEIQTAADVMGEKLAQAGKHRVAVIDFTDLQGDVTELGRFLAEEMSVALASTDDPIEVVDRTHLRVLLQEHKLSTTGLIDPATARKLGQIAGVDALVAGTLTPFGDTVRLTLKMLDASTARIIGATTAEIPKTKAIEELVAQGVGGATAGTVSERRPRDNPKLPDPVNWEGLRFSLKRCQSTGGSVRCEMLIENLTEGSIQLDLFPGFRRRRTRGGGSYTVLSDSSGNKYDDVEVIIGGRDSGSRSGSRILYSGGSDVVHPGIPLAVSLVFRRTPTDLHSASLSLLVEVDGRSQVLLFREIKPTD